MAKDTEIDRGSGGNHKSKTVKRSPFKNLNKAINFLIPNTK